MLKIAIDTTKWNSKQCSSYTYEGNGETKQRETEKENTSIRKEKKTPFYTIKFH